MNDTIDGLRLFVDRSSSTIRIRGLVEDSRETETIPLNSASGNWNISQIANIYDNNWHTLLFMWSCNDTFSLSSMNENGTSALQRGILLFNGVIIGNESTWPGKSTPLEFIFNDGGSGTFFGFGARMSQLASSSISNYTLVDQSSSMIIKRFVMWDRILPDGSTTLDLNSGWTTLDNFDGTLQHFTFWGRDAAEGVPFFWQFYDPLTGSKLKSFSSNVIAYYKFDEIGTESITAIDYAGKDFFTSSSGIQLSPSAGNTIRFLDSSINENSYTIIDTPIPNQDNVFRIGSLQFEDENGIRRKVGSINYDLGIAVFDGQYPINQTNNLSGVPFLQSIGTSGMSLNASQSGNSIYVKRINFTKQNFVERLILNIGASGEEMNITENKTGIDETTGAQLLYPNAGYVSGIGLYNDFGELVGVGKLNHPIRKDIEHNCVVQLQLDFQGKYSGNNIV